MRGAVNTVGEPPVSITNTPEGGPPQSLDTGGRFLRFLLFLAFYYLAYRYPLQINSRVTSPTYSDTPFVLQIGKYGGFVAALAIVLLVSSRRAILRRFSVANAFVFALYGYLLVYPLAQGLMLGDTTLCETGLFFGALIPFAVFSFRDPTLSIAERDVPRFVYVAIIVEVIQVALLVMVGRLPALAYSGSLSIRFGSVWDDPNGFAVFLSFLLGVVLLGEARVGRRILLSLGLIWMLLLTQSLTGIVSTLLAPLVVIAVALASTGRARFVAVLAICALIYLAITLTGYQLIARADWVTLLLSSKSESTRMHVQGYTALAGANVGTLLGLSPEKLYGEPGYVNLIMNHGVIYALSYVLIGLIAARRLLSLALRCLHNRIRGLYWGALFFLTSYYLAMFNLPLERVFPLNLILVVILIIAELGYGSSVHSKVLLASRLPVNR